jgi:hypothetical protein
MFTKSEYLVRVKSVFNSVNYLMVHDINYKLEVEILSEIKYLLAKVMVLLS